MHNTSKFLFEHFSCQTQNLLEKCKFREKERKFDPEIFGNAYLLLGNDRLELRFIKDRLQYYAEIRPLNSKTWYDLTLVLQFLDLTQNYKLDKQIEMLEKHYATICSIFNTPELKTKFLAFKDKKT